MVTTIMATTPIITGPMGTTGTITLVETAMVITTAIAVVTTMGITDSTVPTPMARMTRQMSYVSNAGSLGTMLINARNRMLLMLPSPIHFRRDM